MRENLLKMKLNLKEMYIEYISTLVATGEGTELDDFIVHLQDFEGENLVENVFTRIKFDETGKFVRLVRDDDRIVPIRELTIEELNSLTFYL